MDIIIAILTIIGLVMIFGAAGKGAGAALKWGFSAPDPMRKIRLRRMKSKHARVQYAYYHDRKKIGTAHVVCQKLGEEKSVFAGNIPCLELEAEKQMELYDKICDDAMSDRYFHTS